MLQGICIDNGYSPSLQKGKSYFLFPNGPSHYYVSVFPNKNAHKGCFQAIQFQLTDKEEWPPEPECKPIVLEQDKVYRANLIWRKPGYKSKRLGVYYVRPRSTHGYFYDDKDLKNCSGCFPLHWFCDFELVLKEENEQQLDDFVLEFQENGLISNEREHEIRGFEQLSLF